MAKLTTILLSVLGVLCFAATRSAAYDPLRDQDCVLDTNAKPPRMVCKPRDKHGYTGGGYGNTMTCGRSGRGGAGGGGGEGSFGRQGGAGGSGGSANGYFTGRAGTGGGPRIAGGRRPASLQPARALILPQEMPPAGVAAYGIVAFSTKALAEDRKRFLDVCKAYQSTLIAQGDLRDVPLSEQMITFWPVTERGDADDDKASCDTMVDRYDIRAALDAIRDADQNKEGYAARRGPFLIAWSPSRSRATADAVILVIEMSGMDSPLSFQETFKAWRQKIIDDPKFWRDGFSVEQVRLTLRDTLDRYGAVLLSFLPGKDKP